MLPEIWIFDTYSIMIIIGIIAGLVLFGLYAKKIRMSDGLKYAIAMTACLAVVLGFASAILFQALFDWLEGHGGTRPFAMTFYGGLLGGGMAFILLYVFYIKRKYPESKAADLLVVAPAMIAAAHAFGRVGCFCAGCCYGIETDSWLGVDFPGHTHSRYPTQLFEAFFLFVLAASLFLLAYKKNFRYNLPVYLFSYGVWRFLIEFIRGDDRGAFFLSLSPSQWFSVFAVLGSLPVFLFLYFTRNGQKETVPEA